MNTTPEITEETIDEIAGGYRAAQVLFTACRLNVFGELDDNIWTAREIAQNLDLDPRGTRILLDALAGLGFLERSGTRYRNTPLALDCLCPGSPRSKFAQMHFILGIISCLGQ